MENIGFGHEVHINQNVNKKILVVGAETYIGDSFIKYAKKYYLKRFTIDILNIKNPNWINVNFADYDVVYCVLETVCVSKDTEMNFEISIKMAQKSKQEGVSEFVYVSSVSTYEIEKLWKKTRIKNIDRAVQIEASLRRLADKHFSVAILRLPIVYGDGLEMNIPLLSCAKVHHLFPTIENTYSALHIDNLSELVCQLMLVDYREFSDEGNVFMPQNDQYINVGEALKRIADEKGYRIRQLRVLNVAVWIGMRIPGNVGKICKSYFGNNCFEQALSRYPGIEYQIRNTTDLSIL